MCIYIPTLCIYFSDHFSYPIKKRYAQNGKNLSGNKTTTVIFALVGGSRDLGWALSCGIDFPYHLGQSLTSPLVKLYHFCLLCIFCTLCISPFIQYMEKFSCLEYLTYLTICFWNKVTHTLWFLYEKCPNTNSSKNEGDYEMWISIFAEN